MTADLHDEAVQHVDRALRSYPLAGVDRELFVRIVEAHLQPLSAGRSWLHRQWAAPRGEAVWVGGAVGLHVPRAREAS